MTIFNHIPLVSVIIGIILMITVLTSDKNGYIRSLNSKIILFLIICLNTLSQLDSYIYFNGYENSEWIGLSYLYYHLYGALVFLFTVSIFKSSVKIKTWLGMLTIYTLIRAIFLLSTPSNIEVINERDLIGFLLFLDYIIALLINVGFLFIALLRLEKLKFVVELNNYERVNFKLLRWLIIVSIIIYAAIIQSDFIAYYRNVSLVTQFKIESTIFSLFFFAMSFFLIRFPVFSVQGDIKDLPKGAISPKYAGSNLKKDDSERIWQSISEIMQAEKPYQNPEFRLNDLSTLIDKNLHHVSQVINEKKQMNFFDFINHYRVKDAKELLLSEKGEQYTILAIAFEVGFNSKTTFYNAFKKETGITPSKFRANKTKR